MSRLSIMKLDSMKKLKRELYTNKDKYLKYFIKTQNPIDTIFKNETYYNIIYNLDVVFPKLNQKNTWTAGFENSKKMYESFGREKFPLALALDEKFWIYLAFNEYWGYMNKRWPLNEKNYITRLKNRYFFGKNPERRHELARLYWLSHITFKKDLPNPFELTAIAFEFADPSSTIIERNIGRNPKIVRSAMMAIKNNINHSKIRDRKIFAKFAKEVNNIAGSIIIDFLDEDELEIMFTQLLKIELGENTNKSIIT